MPVPPVTRGPRGEGTYEVGAGENLASAQYLLLRWLIGVLRLDETGCAAGILAVLQRRRVTFVNAFQRAASHTPVEVVHALPLQVKQDKVNESKADQLLTASNANYRKNKGQEIKWIHYTKHDTIRITTEHSGVGEHGEHHNNDHLNCSFAPSMYLWHSLATSIKTNPLDWLAGITLHIVKLLKGHIFNWMMKPINYRLKHKCFPEHCLKLTWSSWTQKRKKR